jgi:hypothetical protein
MTFTDNKGMIKLKQFAHRQHSTNCTLTLFITKLPPM